VDLVFKFDASPRAVIIKNNFSDLCITLCCAASDSLKVTTTHVTKYYKCETIGWLFLISQLRILSQWLSAGLIPLQ
jgi:hypothetical protein